MTRKNPTAPTGEISPGLARMSNKAQSTVMKNDGKPALTPKPRFPEFREKEGWKSVTVVQLAAYIAQREPGQRGFSPQNLWRMRQFFVAYRGLPKLSPLLRELPWSSHLHILSRAKRSEEREFYLRLAAQNHWPVREVARQIESALFARAVLNPPKLSTALRELHPAAASHFKDAYALTTQ